MTYDPTTYEGCKNLVHTIAFRITQRLETSGLYSLGADDVRQELWIVWLKCRERYDPERGANFVTYFYSAALRELNRIINSTYRNTLGIAPLSIQSLVGEDGEIYGSEVFGSEDGNPERILLERERRDLSMSRLSKPARKLVEYMESPPKDMQDALAASIAHAELERRQDQKARSQRGVTTAFLASYLDIDQGAMRELRRELLDAAKEHEEA